MLISSHAVAVQRQWRSQKAQVQVLLLQTAARQMLEQQRAYVEASSAVVLQQYSEAEEGKRKYQKALDYTRAHRRRNSLGAAAVEQAVHAVALKVAKVVDRQKSKQRYETLMGELYSHRRNSLVRAGSNGRLAEGEARRLPSELQQGIEAWLDATRCATPEEGDRVHRWEDISGGGRHAEQRDEECPSFASCAIGGLPALSFSKGEVLACRSGCAARTVALVVQFRSTCDAMMLFSQVERRDEAGPLQDVDFALRMMPSGFRRGRSLFQGGLRIGKDHDIEHNDWYSDPSKLWINGHTSRREWDGFPHRPVCIVAVKQTGRADGTDFLFQLSSRFERDRDWQKADPLMVDPSKRPHDRGFDGWIGEVLVWDRELSDDDAQV